MSVDASLLAIRGLRVHIDGLSVLDLAAIDIADGAEVGTIIMGPNGAGKTTLLNAITGFVRTEPGGHVTLNTRPAVALHRLSRPAKVRAGVSRTFQTPTVLHSQSIREGILLASMLSTQSPWRYLRAALCPPKPDEATTALIDCIVHELRLDAIVDRSAAEFLSDLDVLRRIELARCLATQPRLLFLDEPTAGSDDAERDALANTIHRLCTQHLPKLHDQGLYRHPRLTICVVSHDLRFVKLVTNASTNLIVMEEGRVAAVDTGSILVTEHIRPGSLPSEADLCRS